MSRAADPVDIVGIGEIMALLVPESGPLECATTMSMRMAGAEGNVLIGASRLGHRTALVSAVGEDPFGTMILRTLQGEQVDTVAVIRDPSARTGVFFKDPTPEAQRRVFYYRDGSAASRLTVDVGQIIPGLAPQVLIVSGLTLGLGGPGGMAGVVSKAISACREHAVTVVFDANIRPGLWDGPRAMHDFHRLQGSIDVLLAGRDELMQLMPGRPVEASAEELCKAGTKAVVVKDGPRGAVVIDGADRIHVPAVPVDAVVDPVGAGDAFAVGIVSGLLRGWPIAHGAQLGARLAAHVITANGDWEGLPAGAEADAAVAASRPPADGGQ